MHMALHPSYPYHNPPSSHRPSDPLPSLIFLLPLLPLISPITFYVLNIPCNPHVVYACNVSGGQN